MINKTNITQDLLENVERYFNDNMSHEERSVFENKLKSDETFKLQVEDIKTLLLGIETQSLKEQLDEFHKDVPLPISKHRSTKFKFWQFGKYAAAAILVIALGSYWFYAKPSNEKLYAKYFVADPGLPTTMSASDNYEFFDAMVNYKHGDYKIAISKWEKLQQKKPENDTINYFLGVAQLADKNEFKAIPFLKNAIQQSESIFLNDAYFYLGLAYLKTNELTKAKESFNHSKSEKSLELLAKIKLKE
ncbi:tetratricopeptide repeat protein [Yeosuana sp. AK3]